MKSFTSTILLLVGLANSTPITQLEARQIIPGPNPYQIHNFFASKVHNSASCSFSFSVTSPTLTTPVNCSVGGLDSGWSGSWWLASVYPGVGKCDDSSVTWEYYQQHAFEDTPADFYVTIDGVKGKYVIPKEDISVSENGPSPFDDDVSYSGPADFQIIDFDF
ncbi:hypothetical protein QBC44DRAFT_332940 [Cladorrhinum sp. PSN332]|nr:hypothetical protein QBC44DRAFT_332940 [Cladorrhinum sp. PSN332]